MSAELVGTVLDGKFQIERALASGAAGDVYEAMHLGLGARVAVKVLRPGIPETANIRRKRFMREARVAAGLKSEHVVRLYDIVAPEQGPIYIVMELLQGETLADRVRRAGALPVSEAVDFVLQAAKPLGEMHDEGIVHRDVKPSNLFLARDADGKERIKLLDFGVAAFQQPVARADSSLTLSEVVVGTPRYMAPEQVQASKGVDARADVWALGVTLYELLAGTPPFDGQTVLAVLNQIEHQEPRPLLEVRAEVPPLLAAVVHACLAKDPAGRPANARALGAALSMATGPRKAPRDRRALLLGAAAAAVVLAVGVTVVARRGQDDAPGPDLSAAGPPAVTAPVSPTSGSAQSPLSAWTPPPAVTTTAVATTASFASPIAPTLAPTLAVATAPAAASLRPPQRHGAPRGAGRPAPTHPAARTSAQDDDRIE